jgi:hemolysin D
MNWRPGLRATTAAAKARRTREELEFLPEATEILDSPPSRARSAVMLALCGLVLFGIACAWFGRIDVVATAESRVVPGTRAIPIRSLESRLITRLHVQEGQRVKAGDPLVSLDPTDSEVDLAAAEAERDSASVGIRLLELALAATSRFPSGAIPDFRQAATDATRGREPTSRGYGESLAALLQSELAGLTDEVESLGHQIDKRNSSRAAKEAMVQLHREVTPLRRELLDNMEELRSHGMLPKQDWLRNKESFLTAQAELARTRIEIEELAEEQLELKARRRSLVQTYRSKLQERLVEHRNRADKADISLRRMRHNRSKTVMRAPESGFVHQLALRSEGTAVQAGDTLMLLVPSQSDLEIQAKVQNKDIGWVGTSQAAKIKITSFPYTTHGLLSATVTRVGVDGVTDPRTGEVTFDVTLTLDRHQEAQALLARLAPGMTCTTEMLIEKKRLLSVWLSPLERHLRESFREH